MTPAAAVLFVFVTHGAARGPADDVVAACLRALPAGTRPITRTAPEAPADAALLADAAAAGAVAAVIVAWPAADLPMAEVRAVVGLPTRAQWVSRTVAFGPADQVPERERALGLVIASIVEEGFRRQRRPGAAQRPADAGRLSAGPRFGAPRWSRKPAPVPGAPAPDDGDRPAWAIEAGVTAAYESGTDADDMIGGTLAVRRFVAPNLALRVGAAFRVNQRDTPDVSGLGLIGALGVSWSSAPLGPGRRFNAGVRGDLLLQHQAVRVSGYRMASGERSFWSLGADVLGEVGLRLARGTMLLARGRSGRDVHGGRGGGGGRKCRDAASQRRRAAGRGFVPLLMPAAGAAAVP